MIVDIMRRENSLAELFPRGIEQVAGLHEGGDPHAYVDKPEGSIAFAEMAIEAYTRVHQLLGNASSYTSKELRRKDYGRCPVVAYRSSAFLLGSGDTPGSCLSARATMVVHEHNDFQHNPQYKTWRTMPSLETWVDTFGVELRETRPGRRAKVVRHNAKEHGGWWYDQQGYTTYLERGWERALPTVTVSELARMANLLGALTLVENKLYDLE